MRRKPAAGAGLSSAASSPFRAGQTSGYLGTVALSDSAALAI